MQLDELTAISPVDGRYRTRLSALAGTTSEFALIRYRVRIECDWLLWLAGDEAITQLPAVDEETAASVRAVYEGFSVEDARSVKTLERTTNHDVKAVEYFVKRRVADITPLAAHAEFVHFGCTSEDINNLAYALMLAETRSEILLPLMREVIEAIGSLAVAFADQPMLARTHGQPATPTTLGKELRNVAARLERQYRMVEAVEPLGKMNGAVGNYNAHRVAYPEVDWPLRCQAFVESLGLTHNPLTTQIEPHDWIAELFHALARFNQIVLDFNRDVWGYIAIDYFGQKAVAGETGSSTMPHKVNPIDFENSEGNLGVANALLEHIGAKLQISRWQRDLSDSTVLRAIGTALAHACVAWQATLKGLTRLAVNPSVIERDLDANWEVLAEAVQTVMRKHGLEEPYERLKAATRGRKLDETSYREMVDALELPESALEELRALVPARYLGFAPELALRSP
jgi:adenylosuccinate lyase